MKSSISGRPGLHHVTKLTGVPPMHTTMPISPQQMADLWITFVESGLSRFWCGEAAFYLNGELHSYQDVKMYEGNWWVVLLPEEPDDFEPITILASTFETLPPHPAIGRWLREDSSFDAGDADLIIQFAAFKKEVYA
jgi:hypothetical protein